MTILAIHIEKQQDKAVSSGFGQIGALSENWSPRCGDCRLRGARQGVRSLCIFLWVVPIGGGWIEMRAGKPTSTVRKDREKAQGMRFGPC